MAIVGIETLLSTFSEVFKRSYQGSDEILANFAHPFLARIKFSDGFVGQDEMRMRVTGYVGGYGNASANSEIPYTTTTPSLNPILTAKKCYYAHQLDGEAIAASASSKGAFAELVEHSKMILEKARENLLSLNLLKGDASSNVVLGTIRPSGDSPVTDNGSGSYTVKLVVADFHKPNFHINQVVVVDTSDDPFLVTAINDDATTPTITIVRQSGSQVPAADDVIYLQGCRGNAFVGLPALTAASGTLYNIAINATNNFKAVRDTNGGQINESRLINMCSDIMLQCGENPDLIVCGLGQYKKIREFISNTRIRNDGSDVLGHGELSLRIPGGNLDIIWDQHIENDKIYMVNSKKLDFRRRPAYGLVEGANGILHPMHTTGADKYLIIGRMYGNLYSEPTYHGVFDGLDV